MVKKTKPKNKSKPSSKGDESKNTGKKKQKSTKSKTTKKPATPKKLTAEQKAEQAVKSAQAAYDKAAKSYSTAAKNVKKYASYKKIKDPKKQVKTKQKYDYWEKIKKADKSNKDRKKATLDKAKKSLNSIVKKRKDNEAVASAISKQAKEFNNEGNMAIYPTNSPKVGSIVFFAPTNTESESNTTNVTNYAVDSGSPRKDYARFSSKTITIDGFITGKTPAAAHAKWLRLRSWHSNHTQLTFKGDIYYKQLIISQLDRQFTGYATDTLQVSITFTFVRAAEVKTSSKKSSKSSKTTAGSRSINYTALTVKRGDTLWAYSQKYGKSVSWLQKVNKIKNPNLIYPGQKLRVK